MLLFAYENYYYYYFTIVYMYYGICERESWSVVLREASVFLSVFRMSSRSGSLTRLTHACDVSNYSITNTDM